MPTRVFLVLLIPANVMSEDYRQLLAQATSASEKAESVEILAKILAGEGGKDFISQLNREDGEWCIEILDQASDWSGLGTLGLSWLSGSIGAQTEQRRKADVLR